MYVNDDMLANEHFTVHHHWGSVIHINRRDFPSLLQSLRRDLEAFP